MVNVPTPSTTNKWSIQSRVAPEHVFWCDTADGPAGPWALVSLRGRPARHNLLLISYLYYAKYVFEKESGTLFSRVDLNFDKFLATGRGGNAVQGSVSLDDESAEAGCTELVKGFHKHVNGWWAGVHRRATATGKKLQVTGMVQDLKGLYT